MSKTKRKRGKIKGWPAGNTAMFVPPLDFGGSCSVLVNATGWRGTLLWMLSYLLGHAIFIALVRLFCRERDGQGIFVGDPKCMYVCGNYAMFRTDYCIAVYGALTPAQRQVFVSGKITGTWGAQP